MTPEDRQPGEPDAEAVRSLLARKALADARYRGALARVLGLIESDVLAMQHLAREGALTPGQLGALLRLTSGGTTALVQRLERLGYVDRVPNPRDRRSALVGLSSTAGREVGAVYAPLVSDLDEAFHSLSPEDATVVLGFLERVVAASERRAEELSSRAADERPPVARVPVPGLWA
jgi:DNA-binding MarR family transcriptional regulator